MRRILLIALNEFLTAVRSKAFLVAVLIVPAIGLIAILLAPLFASLDDVRVEGEVVVIDSSGLVEPELEAAFDPKMAAKRRAAEAIASLEEVPEVLRRFAGDRATAASIEAAMSGLFDVNVRGARRDEFDAERRALFAKRPGHRPLALVVIHDDAAVMKPGASTFGGYDMYVPDGSDDRAEAAIKDSVNEAVTAARFREHGAVRTSGLTRETLDAMARVAATPAVTVTADGTRMAPSVLNIVVPAVFGILLVLGVIVGGESLLTAIIEEKTSRILEVLLSSVPPITLMAGKLLGQMAVSMVFLAIYIGGGFVMLTSLSMAGLVDTHLLLYFPIFFAITYLTIGSFMLAVGAVVQGHDDAEFFKTPVILAVVVPWILWLPISRDPNSVLSVSFSFIPPFNTFAMLLRLSSIDPPPHWQVWLSIAIGALSVWASVWFAARVLRISLLMYGKTPSLRELVRMAREG